ncbi:hypothetical protein VULLAG_LOCUS21970 [Vulpes lagopus]
MALRSAARPLRLVLGLAVVAEVSRARGSPRCSCDQVCGAGLLRGLRGCPA